jgi:N6-L-threonylcarbamoyladenine synthase
MFIILYKLDFLTHFTVNATTILAIETSCDETAVAVVEDGWKVLSNVIGSQVDIHAKTGGVVPEVAAREHVRSMIPIVHEALCTAFKVEHDLDDSEFSIFNFQFSKEWIERIDKIAVTVEPGLVTSLLVGTETAKFLGYLWDKEVIEVNHVKGHVAANWLERDPSDITVMFPVCCLSVSGGHNELILLKSKSEWEIIGESQDDAAGEAFDKVARLLGLGYPGGPLIQRKAEEFSISNYPVLRPSSTYSSGYAGLSQSLNSRLNFPRAWLNENKSDNWDRKCLNFSFSGLKSEVQREVERRLSQSGELAHSTHSTGSVQAGLGLSENDRAEIAFAFQEAVCDVLSEKLIEAARRYEVKEVHLAGGVSANLRLREMVQEKLERDGLNLVFRFPESIKYCTDNAAMIGSAAFHSITS